MSNLSSQLSEHVKACFTGLWIESHEHDDAIAEVARLCRTQKWALALWDIDQGLRVPGTEADHPGLPPAGDPLAAIKSLSALAPGGGEGSALLVLVNFHRFLGSPEVVQALAHQVTAGKQNRTFILILAPVVQIPIELEKLFTVLEHDLPGRDQLQEIARGVAQEGELPAGGDLDLLLDAAAGLTRMEAENAYALSLVRQGRLTPASIWELKTQSLKKSGLLQLHRGGETFADLGGLGALKSFCSRALAGRDKKVRPRGVLLLGVPGTGKSAFAKALGNEMGRPTLMMDVGALMGSLVGQTEHNVRQALKIADAMSPAILFVDEIEKALSGVAGSGQSDSGVSARLFGSLLTWLSDHESDVFFVGTCNDISKLPPEFSRAERFDGVFFIDLPSTAEKQAIWNLYLERFELEARQPRPTDSAWTGAEIRACCRLARLLDQSLAEAARNVVPVAVTAAESVGRLRQWASGRCLSSYEPGLYQASGQAAGRAGRRVSQARVGAN